MSMAGYTKLFNSILASTIWREDNETRLVWITLLAMADKKGVAETSIPSLADIARVSLAKCEAALEKLKAPDKYSRTKEHDGRRIAECDGGFLLLNHAKYRAKMSADERREYNRVKQAEHRQRLSTTVKHVNDSGHKSALSAHTEAKADTDTKEVLTIKEVFDSWNNMAMASKIIPQCLIVSSKRLTTFKVRVRDEFFVKNWKQAILLIPSSEFLTGQNNQGWKASFDWFLQPDTVAKIMEGKYHGKSTNTNSKPNPRNDGVIRGPTNYATATPRYMRERAEKEAADKAAMAGKVDTDANNPPKTDGST